MDRTYRVQDGDTLRTIAEKLYGDPAKWQRIFKENAAEIVGANGNSPGLIGPMKLPPVLRLPEPDTGSLQ